MVSFGYIQTVMYIGIIVPCFILEIHFIERPYDDRNESISNSDMLDSLSMGKVD